MLGFIHALLARGHVHRDSKSTLVGDPSPTAASYARALYAGLWAFSGFNQANFVAGEMRYPERDIPRAINISMGLIAVRHFQPFFNPHDPWIDMSSLGLVRLG